MYHELKLIQIMHNHLPPLSALRSLEAVARHRSFTRAATELNVTQSAISHQIRNLEKLWNLELFERGTRPLTLTKCGAALAPVASGFFQNLTATLESLRVEDVSGPLKVSTLESFALTWLVPRLSDFYEHHPEIDVWLSTKDDLIDFAVEDVDLGVRFGTGSYPGLHSSLLLREYIFPVCSTKLLDRLGTPACPADLTNYPLLQIHDCVASSQWKVWLTAAGAPELSLEEGPRFPNTNMALQAAVAGQGIALARSAHVDNGVSTAGLKRLFDVYCPSNSAYYLVCPEGAQRRPRVAAFLNWIRIEAALSQQRYDTDMASTETLPSGE